MASAHHPHASFHQHHANKTVTRAARATPVSKAPFKANKTKNIKDDVDVSVDGIDDDEMISSFLQFW